MPDHLPIYNDVAKVEGFRDFSRDAKWPVIPADIGSTDIVDM